MDPTCHGGYCAKCWSGMLIVIGLILIANQYWLKWDPWIVVGGLIVLKGLMKMVKPYCPDCKPMTGMKGKK